jgi:hypothetical protein
MMGPGHYALGACFGMAYVQVAGLDVFDAILVVPVSAFFSHGCVSPDLDNTRFWQALDRRIPDEQLGEQGPMRHRGILHAWELHLALSLTLATYAAVTDAWWPVVGGAVLAGWWSHLAGDFIVGARSKSRGPGIPLVLWWCHVGLGFKCNGLVERSLVWLLPLVVLPWQAAWYLTGTPQPWTLVT